MKNKIIPTLTAILLANSAIAGPNNQKSLELYSNMSAPTYQSVLPGQTYMAPAQIDSAYKLPNNNGKLLVNNPNTLNLRDNMYSSNIRAALGEKVMTKAEKEAAAKKAAAKKEKRNEMYKIGGGLLLLKLLTSGGSGSGSGYAAPNQPEVNNGNTVQPVGGIVVGGPNN